MSERRIDERMPCFLRAEIVLNNGETRLPCEAHDISSTGLRLAGIDFSSLPESFIVAVPRRQILERVNVVRRMEGAVGVRFQSFKM